MLQQIYIPLCLYLYLRCECRDGVFCKFTFHYVYIYIGTGKSYVANQIYLHSTMFIFIYSHKPYCKYLQKIYIPLCLYLYKNLMLDLPALSVIYIPLCLYLYMKRISCVMWLSLFTFHYVYIYIRFL